MPRQIRDELFYQELDYRLSTMRKGGPLWKELKTHLQPLGVWKDQPRGKPFKTGVDDRRPPKEERVKRLKNS